MTNVSQDIKSQTPTGKFSGQGRLRTLFSQSLGKTDIMRAIISTHNHTVQKRLSASFINFASTTFT